MFILYQNHPYPHHLEMDGFGGDQDDEVKDEFTWSTGGFSGREDKGKDYDKDLEFADIIGSYLASFKLEERLRRKKNKILHSKTGSANPMQVKFNKFDFSNSYIWLEFYNTPLDNDISHIRDATPSWHIIGRLGGCISMNMQLSLSPMEKRPSYDPIPGANVTPTTFYNIGDLEIQDNLARVWVDIGTSKPLLLNILINALAQLSSDYIGIKQVIVGGTEFGNWSDNLTTEEAGYTTHKI
ncbi:uncharacterized protein [Primulina eburnea]|uniref:uncharacterized protein isoform X2 n=1 Tax=Primulina eburnea TaxID=1245227 RepID=UPI003C6CA44D